MNVVQLFIRAFNIAIKIILILFDIVLTFKSYLILFLIIVLSFVLFLPCYMFPIFVLLLLKV